MLQPAIAAVLASPSPSPAALFQAAGRSTDRPLSAAVNTRGSSAATKAVTVLYIEDNPANLRLVQDLFARQPDFELLSAATGGEGLRLAREQHPDLILLDLHLPDISGFQVLETLRAEHDAEPPSVIVISADALPTSIEQAHACGAADYFTKPLNLVELLHRISVALDTQTKPTG